MFICLRSHIVNVANDLVCDWSFSFVGSVVSERDVDGVFLRFRIDQCTVKLT